MAPQAHFAPGAHTPRYVARSNVDLCASMVPFAAPPGHGRPPASPVPTARIPPPASQHLVAQPPPSCRMPCWLPGCPPAGSGKETVGASRRTAGRGSGNPPARPHELDESHAPARGACPVGPHCPGVAQGQELQWSIRASPGGKDAVHQRGASRSPEGQARQASRRRQPGGLVDQHQFQEQSATSGRLASRTQKRTVLARDQSNKVASPLGGPSVLAGLADSGEPRQMGLFASSRTWYHFPKVGAAQV